MLFFFNIISIFNFISLNVFSFIFYIFPSGPNCVSFPSPPSSLKLPRFQPRWRPTTASTGPSSSGWRRAARAWPPGWPGGPQHPPPNTTHTHTHLIILHYYCYTICNKVYLIPDLFSDAPHTHVLCHPLHHCPLRCLANPPASISDFSAYGREGIGIGLVVIWGGIQGGGYCE